MSEASRVSALAPFRVRAFRFQWPADLATSWAFDMETIILSWYVLVETESVLLLTFFVSLQYVGTLAAPMFGVVGDRVGQRNLLCAMRATYATLATMVTMLAFMHLLSPAYVFAIAALSGLVRPSDIGVRIAVVGETLPATQLMSAMAIQRTTQDSARVAGALTGAGVMAALGIGPAYAVVACLYATSFLLTLKAGGRHVPSSEPPMRLAGARQSPWRDLKEGLAYVWSTPHLLAVMCLAFLLNVTAFPQLTGFLPYVAKEIYRTDQTGLGYMVASAAFGALMCSIVLSRLGSVMPPARMMMVSCLFWYSMLFVFAHTQHPVGGILVLMLVGCGQSLANVPMATLLLRTSDPRFRGRIMGVRMMAIYGNLPGLWIAGPLINHIGYPVTATVYCIVGMMFTLLIGVRWRADVWRLEAVANAR
ncbi:MAG TPA: MFS transporter [Burkholderiales bacterium]|nr:MFS transporter [Burkholderiales bacterium]